MVADDLADPAAGPSNALPKASKARVKKAATGIHGKKGAAKSAVVAGGVTAMPIPQPVTNVHAQITSLKCPRGPENALERQIPALMSPDAQPY